MESFHWDKHFETGLSDVDDQHHRLVDIINVFGNHLAANEINFKDLEVLFKDLGEYTQYHFDAEETLMREIGMDERHLTSHIDDHQGFLNEVIRLSQDISSDKPEGLRYILDFLTQWLAYHILGLDQNMARQIHLIQDGLSPKDAYDKEEREQSASTKPLLFALNSLFHQVSARNLELLKLNESLEAKVAERTQALLESNQHLEELALTDVLTKLPNRRYAMRSFAELWQESIDGDVSIACMMIDADHFKAVNDTYGHDAGDDVLCELSKAIRHSLRTDDIVCRLGGDEFLVICPGTDLKGAMHIAEITRQKVAALKVPTGDGAWYGSISIGVAAKTADIHHYEDLMKVADESVYLAKQAGKNCVKTAHL